MDYNGTYALVSSENFTEFLKAMDMNAVQRKAAELVKPSIVVKVDGNRWNLKQTSKIHTTEMVFELGVPRHIKTPKGNEVISVITKEGDTLVEKRSGDEKPMTTLREFTGSQLKVTLTLGDVTCVRTFEKK